MKLGVSQGTAGSVYTTIDFTNISNVTCTLYGYPGVSLQTAKPVHQIGKPAKENPSTPRQLVTLQPQTTGNALLQIVDAGNYPPSTCGPVTAHYLQVYPPNQTTPTYIKYKTQACSKPVRLMTVDVVKPGSAVPDRPPDDLARTRSKPATTTRGRRSRASAATSSSRPPRVPAALIF